MKRRGFRIAAAVLTLGIGVSFAAAYFPSLQGGSLPRQGPRGQAPEFVGISQWINSEPLTLQGLRGKVVWIDFWTYSCINCVRTFPHIREFYARYHSFGLEIVGVHSPEFSFEKDPDNVRAAIERHRLPYPVAMDNDMTTWRAYRNAYWPRVFLVDVAGRIRYDHIGEGGEEGIQREVRRLLREAGASLPPSLEFGVSETTPHITPEIYLGSRRARDEVTLQGDWKVSAEYVTARANARLDLDFFARDVFFVAGGKGRVRLLLDGKPVDAADLGAHAQGGVVAVGRDDLFHALRLREAAGRRLTLLVDPGLRVYTFTFG